jgi:hypothetical protein
MQDEGPALRHDGCDGWPGLEVPDVFSARWQRRQRLVAGEHAFSLKANGQAILSLDGHPFLRAAGGETIPGSYTVLPGDEVVDLDVEYVHETGTPHLALDWIAPTPTPTPTSTPLPTLLPTSTPPCLTPTPPCITPTPLPGG